ncbi:MAG TPA: DUF308 domain-containing protein [Candidatus Pacearchaeota archaeon]|nr:DUF308 domain-containing protein [Candidatus Pacearchaeota archaeon]HPR79973.1 DUF308 domain-containing protein [Candidatus Pacearchaeota archaeon]
MEKKSNFFVINIVDNYIKEVSGNWWLVFLNGLVAIALGLSFMAWPEEALKIFAYFIGAIIILFGLQYIRLSFKVKGIKNKYEKVKQDIKSKFE